jgi:hypothetical protein
LGLASCPAGTINALLGRLTRAANALLRGLPGATDTLLRRLSRGPNALLRRLSGSADSLLRALTDLSRGLPGRLPSASGGSADASELCGRDIRREIHGGGR